MNKIEKDFSTVLDDSKVSFFGNVWVCDADVASKQGCTSITVQQLRQKYSAVILAYGAISDRELGIPGEN
jgi:NADPH-dependent glutamate synthase beta subunit-like oxidoreductase